MDHPVSVVITARDTLYLYDMVQGDVKVIATSPRGDLVRIGPLGRRLALEVGRRRGGRPAPTPS